MTTLTLAIGTSVVAATVVTFAYLARVILQRPAPHEHRAAVVAFAVWWLGIAFVYSLTVAREALVLADVGDHAVLVSITHAGVAPLVIALGSLLYYLLHIVWGRKGLAWAISALYAGMFLLFEYAVVVMDPVGVRAEAWQASVEYANAMPPMIAAVVFILLLAPIMLGAAVYALLFFRMERAEQRYRTGLIAATIFGWFGTALLALTLGWSDEAWWGLASRVIGFGAGLSVLLAYRPPAAVRAYLERARPAGGAAE